MNRALSLAICLAASALGAFACRPLPGPGDSCADAPCAGGLRCVDEVCVRPEAPVPDPEACQEAADCAIEGSAEGRGCIEGRCAFLDCTFDAQCGERICNRGTCALRITCDDERPCDAGQVCESGACREACSADEECGAFAQCDVGRCAQRCFFDLMCGGDLCDEGICVPAQCVDDADCPEDGATYACEAGRCNAYVPCAIDAECYDADYRCNELGRCEMRPACRVDAECGAEALCLNALCRPAAPCDDNEACESNQECVASRCASRLSCRSDLECAAEQTCTEGRCQEVLGGLAAELVVATPLGDCEATGAGACEIVLFEGERIALRVAAFADDGAPLRSSTTATLLDAEVGRLESERSGQHSLTALQPGVTSLQVRAGASLVHEALRLRVVAVPSTGVAVLVVQERSGAPAEGVQVSLGGEVAQSDALGLALFPAVPATAGDVWLVLRQGEDGYAWVGPASLGALRVLWPSRDPPVVGAVERFAGFTARVASSGDETGAIGLGFALPALARSEDARLATLFGPTYAGALSVPLLGGARIPLPAAATLEVSLPLLGAQPVRETAFALTVPGRRGVLAYEGRYPESDLFALIGSDDATALAMDFAARAPGMDAALAHVGQIAALPSVVDGDGADGWVDVDSDGDTTDRVPDYGAFPAISLTPTLTPRERVGLRLGGLPAEARARVFAVAGIEVPGYGFQPTGIGALTPPAVGLAVEQLKAQLPSSAGLAQGRRALVVEAVFDDPTLASTLHWRGDAFSPDVALGEFLTPPSGAFLIEGVPSPEQRLLVLPAAPGADVYRIRLVGAGVRWDVFAAASESGRSIVLPPVFSGGRLLGVEVYRLGGAGEVRSIESLIAAGSGPVPLASRARAYAAAGSGP